MPAESADDRSARIDSIRFSVARGAFSRAVAEAGFDLPESAAARIFENSPEIQKMIIVYSDNEIAGIREAVKFLKEQYPDLFNRSGYIAPRGTPPRPNSTRPETTSAPEAIDRLSRVMGRGSLGDSASASTSKRLGVAAKLAKRAHRM